MVDVDLRAFIQTDGLDERVLAIAPAIPRREAQQLDAANDARRAIDPQPLARRESTNSCSSSDMSLPFKNEKSPPEGP